MKVLASKLLLGICTLVLLTAFSMPLSVKLTDQYIDSYKSIAVSEMHRTGIPASIKLAQGILESDFGRSMLAVNARNHFGIKCGGDWVGDTFFIFDDDTDHEGTLIESCFRSYNSADESYIAHSDFLTNPSKKARYGFLFELATTDYVGWANGLRFAGYATDPSYPQKLISIIEKYKLYKFDEDIIAPSGNPVAIQENPRADAPVMVEKSKKERPSTWDNGQSGKMKTATINGLKMVYAAGGETIQRIALATGHRVSELLEYNEEIQSMDYMLAPGEIVYLERKKKNIEGEAQFHQIQKGETMYSVSQLYGIRLESLLAKNNLMADALPLEGQEISLVKQLNKNQTPKYRLVERFDSYVDLGSLR